MLGLIRVRLAEVSPTHQVFQYGSIRELAAIVDDEERTEERYQPIICLHSGILSSRAAALIYIETAKSKLSALFIAPPAGGLAFPLVELAKELALVLA